MLIVPVARKRSNQDSQEPMAAVAMELTAFKESVLSPWARKQKPGSRAGGRRTPLLDAGLPPAQKNPSEVVGCISYVNEYLSKEGLQRRNTLPPVIFDLYSPPPPSGSSRWLTEGKREREEEVEGEEEGDMAHRRGAVKRKKSLPERQDLSRIPPIVSKHTQAALAEIDSTASNTLLIELANYPGYNPHVPTPLPHGLKTIDQMRRVTSSQSRLATKQEWYRDAWCKLFYCPESMAIFLDYFWWFFLHKYQTNQHAIQDLLFTRIADNYVKMLWGPGDTQFKDSFFKMYPDIIAQCVYTALLHSYPNSWNSFDDPFKTELCQYISIWQVGIKPMPSSWRKWEMYRLEPPNLPKLDSNDELSASKGFNFDALLQEAREKAEKTAKLESFFEKRLTLDEVKRRLSDRKSTASSSGSVSPQPADNTKMGVAIEQLSSVADEHKAASLARLSPRPVSSPQSSPTSLDQRKELLAAKPGPSTQLTVTAEEKKLKPKSVRHKMIKITDPEGKDLKSSDSSLRSSGASKSACAVTTRRGSVGKNGRKSAQRQQRQPQKQQQQQQKPPVRTTTAPVRGIHEGNAVPVEIRDRIKTSIPRPSQQHEESAGMRAISAPAFGHKHRAFDHDSTPVPGGPFGAGALSTDKRSEEYFTYKKMAMALKEKKRDSVTLQGPAFDHVLFNVYGQSPLVKHYMDNMKLTHENEKEVVVGRTEISDEPPCDAVCYKDILSESRMMGALNREQFLRQYRSQRRSMIIEDKRRHTANQEHEQNVKLVMANRKEVQQLSNELALHAIQPKLDYDKRAVSSAITTTLKRASMTTCTSTSATNTDS